MIQTTTLLTVVLIATATYLTRLLGFVWLRMPLRCMVEVRL